MIVKEIMTKKVITVTPTTKIIEASKLMLKHDLGLLVVVNEKREVLGVITDRDIVLRMIALDKNDLNVDEVMTHVAKGINYEATIIDCLNMMKEHQVRRLVVLDKNEKLCGIISLADIAHCKYTTELIPQTFKDITTINRQKSEPLKYLKVDDFPL